MNIETVKAKFNSARQRFQDFQHKVLDVVDAIKADPKKQLAATGLMAFVLGFVFAKVFA